MCARVCVRACHYCTPAHTLSHTHCDSTLLPLIQRPMSDETIEVGVDIVKQFTDEPGKIIGVFRGYVSEVDVHECDGSVLYAYYHL